MMARRRKALAAVLGAVTVVGVAVGAGPRVGATTVPPRAVIQVKGPGSNFTHGFDSHATQTIGVGQTATFGVRVVNTGTVSSSFHFGADTSHLNEAKAVLTANSAPYRPLGTFVYDTPVLKPGQAVGLTLKLTAIASWPNDWTMELGLIIPNPYQLLDTATVGFSMRQTKGTGPFDLYASAPKQAYYPAQPDSYDQPFVGGTTDSRVVTAPAIAPGGHALFVVRMQNDTSTPGSIGGRITDLGAGYTNCAADFPIRVTDAGADVTSQFMAGSYNTPVLAPGASHTVILTVTHPGPVTSASTCTGQPWGISTVGSPYRVNETLDYLWTNLAA